MFITVTFTFVVQVRINSRHFSLLTKANPGVTFITAFNGELRTTSRRHTSKNEQFSQDGVS